MGERIFFVRGRCRDQSHRAESEAAQRLLRGFAGKLWP